MKKFLAKLFDDPANKILVVFYFIVNLYLTWFAQKFLHYFDNAYIMSLCCIVQLIYVGCGVIFAENRQNKYIYLISAIYPLILLYWFVPVVFK